MFLHVCVITGSKGNERRKKVYNIENEKQTEREKKLKT